MKAKNSDQTGFTLIEIMIVVAIIGLLAAIAIPNFVRARSSSQQNACINNLRQIDSAKQQWALSSAVMPSSVPGDSILQPYMGRGTAGSLPVCPVDSTSSFDTSYNVNTLQSPPTCKIVTTHLIN